MITKSILLLALSVSFLIFIPFSRSESLPKDLFINPIGEGADPWITRDPNSERYLWCFSEGNRSIAIHTSNSITSLGEKHIIWHAPDSGPTSREVWAPELHWIQNRWHVYFAPSNGQNRNHRAYVLRSKSQDPLGEYEIHGPLPTGNGPDGISPNIWAIDMTPLEHDGKLYAIWSGWDEPDSDRQFLYIAPMKSPVDLAGQRVLLCKNDDHPWEFTEDNRKGRGLHEAPQILKHGNRTFLTYSTGASWLPTYKLGLLELKGTDPLNPTSWKKSPNPVFASTDTTFGVGHSCFVPSPDGLEKWHVYHAKRSPAPGWQRNIFAQPMTFTNDGFPDFGEPLASNIPIPLPSGTKTPNLNIPYTTSLKSTTAPQGWSPYGHHQFISFRNDGLHLGIPPQAPVNDYRSGEKLVLNSPAPPDFTASVTLNFNGKSDARDAGLLFRTTAPSIGYDAQRGYFAGLIPNSQIIILGKTDGKSWTELARSSAEINPAQPHHLKITCIGPSITIHHNGRPAISFSDSTYPRGTVGLRVVDSHATFSDFSLTTLD